MTVQQTLNAGHPTFFGESQDKFRTKESDHEFVHQRTCLSLTGSDAMDMRKLSV